jgi:hypothetical protein
MKIEKYVYLFIFVLSFSACSNQLAVDVKSSVTPADTQEATRANAPTSTLTFEITRIPMEPRQPTQTEIPQPEWVTDFSQPILNAIASREPNFQDDFNNKSGGWQRLDWCGEWRVKNQDGRLMLTDCGVYRANINYPDFVLQVDGTFQPDSTQNATWGIFFRDMEGPWYAYGVNLDGSIGLWGFDDEYQSFPSAAFSGNETNRLLIIAKGSKFAFYLNGKPFYYIEDSSNPWGDIKIKAWCGESTTENPDLATIALDNFMIWDISEGTGP